MLAPQIGNATKEIVLKALDAWLRLPCSLADTKDLLISLIPYANYALLSETVIECLRTAIDKIEGELCMFCEVTIKEAEIKCILMQMDGHCLIGKHSFCAVFLWGILSQLSDVICIEFSEIPSDFVLFVVTVP